MENYDFEERRAHAFNKINWHVPKHLRGRFLDIGCGPGNGVIAALQNGFSMAIGLDRDLSDFPDAEKPIDDLCSRYALENRNAMLIEGDLFNLKFQTESFDCVMMLDSIEHVPNPVTFIQHAAHYLKPGGVFLLDACPLFYSIAGAHLFNHFDPDTYPWVHLRKDFDILVEREKVDPWSMTRFKELNKITHQQIRDAFEANGLRILEESRGQPTDKLQSMLDDHRDNLVLSGIEESLLFEDWILLVGRRERAAGQ